jgi:hypothetical protein
MAALMAAASRISARSSVRSNERIAQNSERPGGGIGQPRIGPQDDPVELTAGDYIAVPADLPHLYEALEPKTWAILITEHP